MPPATLGDRELDVMLMLWEHESGTVQEVRDHVDRSLAYTTVLTILRNLEAKGFVRRTAEGRGHRYYPRVARERARKSALARLLGGLFRGAPDALVLGLAEHGVLSAGDLTALAARVAALESPAAPEAPAASRSHPRAASAETRTPPARSPKRRSGE